MLRTRWIWSVLVVWMMCLGIVSGAQIAGVRLQPRDGAPAPPAPGERLIPVGTSVISGTVFASGTELPIAGARVSLSGNAGDLWLTRTLMTDSSGQFTFTRLPAGAFKLNVSSNQNQFFPTNYGARRPGGEGRYVLLADGQSLALKVPLLQGSVITGSVTGEGGAPMRQVNVTAVRLDTTSGVRRLEMTQSVQTDDRGVYRLYGLRPGDYFIVAKSHSYALENDEQADEIERAILTGTVGAPSGPGKTSVISIKLPSRDSMAGTHMNAPRMYLPVYAPGSVTPSDASVVTLAAHDERTGIDIRMQLVPATNIQGVVSTTRDPGVAVQLRLESEEPSGAMHGGRFGQADKDGRFSFLGLEPGSYTVWAQTMPGAHLGQQGAPTALTDAQKMWGHARVTVNGGEQTIRVALSLQPSRSISGIVLFDTERRPDTQIIVTARPVESGRPIYRPGGNPQATAGADGRFTITGVPPGTYVIDANWTPKSSMVAGHDTLDFPLEFSGDRDVTDAVITVSHRRAHLSGTLTNSVGKPVLDYVIVAAATDSRYWRYASRRVQMVRPDHSGQFTLVNLPPGQYQLSVVEDVEGGELNNPEFLRMLARTSVSVIVPEGGTITQHLRVK